MLQLIYERSVRKFLKNKVENEEFLEILNAGRWAPSGRNNQAWRFILVKGRTLLRELAKLTTYGDIIEKSHACITVFLDEEKVYDRTKDVQSVGACIENMLLAAHSMNLGAVWLGEILKNKKKARTLLGAPESFELMAVLAVGYPEKRERKSTRYLLDQIAWQDKYGTKLNLT